MCSAWSFGLGAPISSDEAIAACGVKGKDPCTFFSSPAPTTGAESCHPCRPKASVAVRPRSLMQPIHAADLRGFSITAGQRAVEKMSRIGPFRSHDTSVATARPACITDVSTVSGGPAVAGSGRLTTATSANVRRPHRGHRPPRWGHRVVSRGGEGSRSGATVSESRMHPSRPCYPVLRHRCRALTTVAQVPVVQLTAVGVHDGFSPMSPPARSVQRSRRCCTRREDCMAMTGRDGLLQRRAVAS